MGNAVCAAKTGTTNDNKDVWFVGYSRYYTTAVWSGYDLPEEISDGYGTKCSGLVWQKYMTGIHDGLEIKEFLPYMRQDGTMSNGEPATEPVTTNPSENTTAPDELYTDAPEETTVFNEEPETGATGNSEEITTSSENDRSETTGESHTTMPEYHTTAPKRPPKPSGAGTGELYTEYWGE